MGKLGTGKKDNKVSLKNNFMEIPEIILIFCFIFLFFIILNAVLSVSQEDLEELTRGECNLSEFLCNFGQALGIPRAWMNSRVFLKYVFIPFLSIFSIIYGTLNNARIFPENRINVVISILIALFVLQTGAFTFIVVALFSALGIFSVVIFFFLFFLGIFIVLRFAFKKV